jgi:lipoprotein-anchoring transpeptidase ErfK/SrfK
MITRRKLMASALVSVLATPSIAQPGYQVPRRFMPREIDVNDAMTPGAIYVHTEETWLYLVLRQGRAIRYKVAVGEDGRNFEGLAHVGRKAEWPSWIPTASMIEIEPEVYGPYARGLPGGHERNPLGARALYLYDGGRDTYFRIHGTPQPWTMGQAFSSGCVRLVNEHMIDLYDRVPVGTPVVTI